MGSLGALRDDILGITRSQEEVLRSRAKAFNAELEVMRASLLAKKAELEASLSIVAGHGKIVERRIDLWEAELSAGANFLDGMGQIVRGTGAAAAALASIAEALAMIEDLVIGSSDLAEARVDNWRAAYE